LYIALIFLFSLFAGRLSRTLLTAPILFTAAGLFLPEFIPFLREHKTEPDLFLQIAELGLVLLLFTDASRTDLGLLKSIRNLPARLLGPGMLLTILLGALAALVVFNQLTLWEAGILGAILAPTDAGLGQIIVNSPLAPARIRQALNVEAGLNDGLSVPFLLFFMAIAGRGESHTSLFRLILEQLGAGALIGTGIGYLGGRLIAWARSRQWTDHAFEPLAVVALPLLCFPACEAVGASVFIAAFIAGLAAQAGFKDIGKHSSDFSEEWGQLLNLFVFFLFGLHIMQQWELFRPAHLLYALLSLTIVRMLPVAICLRGTRLSRPTVLFMGWFGPRGLASIVLTLVYNEHQPHSAGEPTIVLAAMVTTLLSIFAHGLSALPGIKLYAKNIANLGPEAPENRKPSTTTVPIVPSEQSLPNPPPS
jgi:NhaP-type Na+/H+ or K+/H+ antiporter